MIRTVTGNLLAADVDALVNTVNTVGVMGKGIALQFKNAYPQMFKAYARAVKAGEVQLGRMHIWETGQLDGPRYIINFPTKGHWRSGSKIRDIDAGLVDLVSVIKYLGIGSIAIPPLGAGNGGLEWDQVEPRIRAALAALPDIDARVYTPTFTPRAAEMKHASEPPAMTPSRAALVVLLGAYERTALGATPLELQKLMYFLQEAGEPLRLRYQAHLYGPYADNLRHVLNQVEGHYVTGYGDASSRVVNAEPLAVLPEAVPAATSMLSASPDTTERIDRVTQLTEGFASMYGLELLATVHWCAIRSKVELEDRLDELVEAVHEWSPRKRDMFTSRHIHIAWKALKDQSWLIGAP